MENDAPEDSESLTIDQAAAAYTKSQTTAVPKDDAKVEDEAPSDDTTDEELQEGDEPESETEDGEPAEEDDAEQGEDDEPESDQGRFVADNAKVRLADGTVTTVSELKRGSLREADYTRKTQEVAAKDKEVAAQSERIASEKQQIEQMREYNISLIKSIIPPEPDPNKANPSHPDYDPAGYQAEQVARQQWAQHLAYLESQQTQAQQERATKASETEKETANREWTTLTEKLPHLKDSKRVDAFVAEITKTAQSLGVKPEEMKLIALDHRYAMALYKAGKWDALQASKPKVATKVEGRPSVIKGGKRQNPSESRARAATDATNRLQSSGRLDDAVAAYLAIQK
jgi:hypothetical protein